MKETSRNKRASIDIDIAVKHPLNAFKDGRVVNAPSSRTKTSRPKTISTAAAAEDAVANRRDRHRQRLQVLHSITHSLRRGHPLARISSAILLSASGSFPLTPTTGGPKRSTSFSGSPATTHRQWCAAIVGRSLCSVTLTRFFPPATFSISHTHSSGTTSRNRSPCSTTRSVSPAALGSETANRTVLVSIFTATFLDVTALGTSNATTISFSVCVHVYASVRPPHSSGVSVFMPPRGSAPMFPAACRRAICTAACLCSSAVSSGEVCPKVCASFASSSIASASSRARASATGSSGSATTGAGYGATAEGGFAGASGVASAVFVCTSVASALADGSTAFAWTASETRVRRW
mmetsp:Transcript_10307/g.43340  ORF Transcript_10307/g.43340 Transcript_10307/m.43340 type:complete len:350 (-) Transcript_10307:139-1188(-)